MSGQSPQNAEEFRSGTTGGEEHTESEGSFTGEFEFELSRTKVALRIFVDATKRGGLAMLRAFKWMVVKVVGVLSIAAIAVLALYLRMQGKNNSN